MSLPPELSGLSVYDAGVVLDDIFAESFNNILKEYNANGNSEELIKITRAYAVERKNRSFRVSRALDVSTGFKTRNGNGIRLRLESDNYDQTRSILSDTVLLSNHFSFTTATLTVGGDEDDTLYITLYRIMDPEIWQQFTNMHDRMLSGVRYKEGVAKFCE